MAQDATDNTKLVWTLYQLFNDRDLERAIGFAATDLIWLSIPFGRSYHGPEGYREYLEGWLVAFPDARVEVRNLRVPNTTDV